MGQYAGQPDFGTIAANLTPSNVISSATNLNQACIYIGGPAPIANITCILSGVTGIQGVVSDLNPRSLGTGYTVANGLAVTPSSGEGTGLTVNITAINAAGGITAIAIATAGSAYRQGDIITIIQATGSNSQFFINVVDALPTAGDAVTFTGYPSGSFLPVIVDYVLATGTTGVNLLAIK